MSNNTFRYEYLHGGRAECDHITKFVLYFCYSCCCSCCYRTQMKLQEFNCCALHVSSSVWYARLFAWFMHVLALPHFVAHYFRPTMALCSLSGEHQGGRAECFLHSMPHICCIYRFYCYYSISGVLFFFFFWYFFCCCHQSRLTQHIFCCHLYAWLRFWCAKW